jgi:hypothetical protein
MLQVVVINTAETGKALPSGSAVATLSASATTAMAGCRKTGTIAAAFRENPDIQRPRTLPADLAESCFKTVREVYQFLAQLV